MSNAFLNFAQRLNEMIFNSGNCCCCSGKIHKGRHDFMVREGNEIVVVKDVPAIICDTCGEFEYTLGGFKRDPCDREGPIYRKDAGNILETDSNEP